MKKVALLFVLIFVQTIFSQKKEYQLIKSNIGKNSQNFGIAFCSNDFVIYAKSDPKNKRRIDTDFYLGYLNESGKIVNEKKLSNDVNSKFSEVDATFTKDGKTVFFTRKTSYRRQKPHFKIFKATVKTPGYWVNIQPVWFNSNNYSVMHPSLSPDDKILYFVSDMDGGLGGKDLYKSIVYKDGKLGKPINMGKRFNSVVDDTTPFADENNTLYFSSNGRAGYGGLDIYSVNLSDKSVPVNVGKPINSSKDDYYYVEKFKDNCGHFVSNRENTENKKNKNTIFYFKITNKDKLQQEKAISFTEKDRKKMYKKEVVAKKTQKKVKKVDKEALARRRKELLGY